MFEGLGFGYFGACTVSVLYSLFFHFLGKEESVHSLISLSKFGQNSFYFLKVFLIIPALFSLVSWWAEKVFISRMGAPCMQRCERRWGTFPVYFKSIYFPENVLCETTKHSNSAFESVSNVNQRRKMVSHIEKETALSLPGWNTNDFGSSGSRSLKKEIVGA